MVMTLMKLKISIILIIFLLIFNIINGCIQNELDKNSEETTFNFDINNMQIIPNITIPRQSIMISIDVENLNNSRIDDSVTLSWDNGEKLSKNFQLDPFEIKTITWEISENETGVYNVSIDKFNGSYEISDKIAWFELSDLKIQSDVIEINETSNISINVENIGYISDYYILDLYVNGIIEQTKKVMVDIGETKNISFQFNKSDLDIYIVGINELKDEIQVVEFRDISNIEIIELNITSYKRVKEGCCYKDIIIDNGFNYSSDVQFYVINGTVLNKNDFLIKGLKVIGNFYDIDGIILFSQETDVYNLSYLTEEKFSIVVYNKRFLEGFNRIDYIKFEFEVLYNY